MSFGHRIFIVEGDEVIRISQRSFNDFYFREQPEFPQFGGSTVQFALDIFTLERRMPKQIVRIDCQRVQLAADGSMDQKQKFDTFRMVANRIDRTLFPDEQPGKSGSPANVVDASARFDDRRWNQLHPELSGPAHKRILEALFGKGRAI